MDESNGEIEGDWRGKSGEEEGKKRGRETAER